MRAVPLSIIGLGLVSGTFALDTDRWTTLVNGFQILNFLDNAQVCGRNLGKLCYCQLETTSGLWITLTA